MNILNTLQSRIMCFLIGMMLVSTVLNMAYFYYSLDEFAQESSDRTENNIYERRESELENLVSVAYTTVERFYNESQNVDRLKQKKQSELKKILNAVFSQAEHFYRQNKDNMERAGPAKPVADLR